MMPHFPDWVVELKLGGGWPWSHEYHNSNRGAPGPEFRAWEAAEKPCFQTNSTKSIPQGLKPC